MGILREFRLLAFGCLICSAGQGWISQALANEPSLQRAEIASQRQMIPELGKGGHVVLSMVDYSGENKINPTRYEIIRAILELDRTTKILLLHGPRSEDSEENIRFTLSKKIPAYAGNENRFSFLLVRHNIFSWARDYVSELVVDGSNSSFVNFRYFKDEGLTSDAQDRLIEYFDKVLNLKIKKDSIDLIGDGGMYSLDSENRLFVAESLKERNRKPKIDFIKKNPNGGSPNGFNVDPTRRLTPKTDAAIEKLLMSSLGAKEVIWLPVVDSNSEPTQHLDMYMKILNNKQAVVADTNNARGKPVLDKIAAIMQNQGFTVTRIVNVKPNDMAFRSYTNSLILGNSIIVPRYGVNKPIKADLDAKAIYERLGYNVIQVDGNSIDEGGSIHCLTKIIPIDPINPNDSINDHD
jgi:agmatine/peptidylarginine deiminase